MKKKSHYQLSNKNYKTLKVLLGREPETLEIVLALALWNEHCSYASSKIHLKKFQFSTKRKVSGIGEQAGVVDLGEGERVSFKMESHNHPSFIAPYHGAATGVGGILRDVFAMNARPIALADYLCFGEVSAKGNIERVDAVVRGIGDYGNCMGIPTITGYTEFSSSYNENILVNAMALGYLGSETKEMSSKLRGVGSYVVYAGASTGRDGILGADMASQSFEGESQEIKTTVQIGDPFFGKQLMEACLLAMEKHLIVACQDMGAAGLTCSSFEMADKGGMGLNLHLDKVPLRDQSMGPEEILLSESQERMLFVCEPSRWEELKSLFENYGLEIFIVGEVLEQKEIELFWKGKRILKTDPQFWTRYAPVEDRPYILPKPAKRVLAHHLNFSGKKIKDLLLKALQNCNGRSRKFIYRQYDQRVGTHTLKDASYPIAVLKLPESKRELGIAVACRPYLMDYDVEQGAKDSVFQPAIQLALRGFQPWAVTDCLNFGNPEKKEIMGEFIVSVENIAKACQNLSVPIVSGNVSFYNESQGKNITPTPAIGMIGLKTNSKLLPSSGFQKEGEKVYLLSSHQFYFEGAVKQLVDEASTKPFTAYGGLQDSLMELFIRQLLEISEKSLFLSAKLVGKFGLAYTLSRMVLENGVGFSLEKLFPHSLLQERLYEIVISVLPEKEKELKNQLEKSALDYKYMGESLSSSDLILPYETLSYEEMKQAYLKPWEGDLSL